MRFNSVRTGNYAQSAQAVTRASDQIFDAAMSGKPDFTKISKAAIKGRSLERRAATQAEGNVAKAGLEAFTYAKRTKNAVETEKEIANIKRPARRMAGIVGGLGVLAGGAMMSVENNRAKKRQAERDAAAQAKEDARSKMLTDFYNRDTTSSEGPELLEIPKYTPSSSSSSSSSSGSTLTGVRKELADAIAGPESGPWGYDAFNQGGAKGGTKVLGKSGSHKEVFGRSLTDMTLGEIFERQNLPEGRHYQDGGLHAVGRYQFIGPTLREEVDNMGLSYNTKFTPEIQDKIFFSHAKRIGDISPWIGPSTKYDEKKRNYLNSLIPQL